MRIIQINNCHYRRGGADVVYLNTGNLLETHGHKVIYFSQHNPKTIHSDSFKYFVSQFDYFSFSFLKKILITPRFFYSLEAKKKLEKLIVDERPDIAHVHTYKGALTPSILVALKKHNIPVVISLHDYGLLCPHNSFYDGNGFTCERCSRTNNPVHCIINKCNNNSYIYSAVSAIEYVFHKKLFPFHKFFTVLIALSKFSQDFYLNKSIYKNKTLHLYNFYPSLATTVPNNMHEKYFLFYGRLSREKGIFTLLKAWKEIGLVEDYSLKIAGDGPLMPELKAYAENNNLKNVFFLGFVEGNSLIELIKKSFFIIVPSECFENNPLTVIEAYANGKPVIGSRVGGIPEIIMENETGHLFEMGNHISLSQVLKKTMTLSGMKYSEYSAYARHFAMEHFSDDQHYKQLIDIYSATIKK